MLNGTGLGMSKIGHILSESRKSYLRKCKAATSPIDCQAELLLFRVKWSDREVVARPSNHEQYFHPNSLLQDPIVSDQ